MQTLPRVLLVEDDRSISGALVSALQSSYEVDTAFTGRLAIYKTDNDNYDVILLDLNLPDLPGLAICQQLRERGLQAPILILTGEASVMSKITLLDAGANDYLTKPFSLGELKARLRVLTRPNQQIFSVPTAQLSACGLELNRQNREVSRDGVSISLRRKEFALLECLMENAGSVVSRATLGRFAWQSDEIWTNTIDVHIKHLRDKVDRPFELPVIHTVHGLGYKLELSAIKQEVK
ncbi:MAG TPA: response regulator transcription factor [Candidatus Saccharimonadia bacterium]|nr:response regulator transcription factor [Candidatus Saccharimonadia bacterium]